MITKNIKTKRVSIIDGKVILDSIVPNITKKIDIAIKVIFGTTNFLQSLYDKKEEKM